MAKHFVLFCAIISRVKAGGDSTGEEEHLTNKERFLLRLENFENATEKVKEHPFYEEVLGENLKAAMKHSETLDLLGYVKSKAKRGLVMRLDNLSKRTLGDPKEFIRCGWVDDKLGTINKVERGVSEVTLFHNFYKSMRSSCGVVTWQVQDSSGHPWRFLGGYSLRLFVTWSMLDSGLGAYKCKEGRRNQFVIGFEKVILLSGGINEHETFYYFRFH